MLKRTIIILLAGFGLLLAEGGGSGSGKPGKELNRVISFNGEKLLYVKVVMGKGRIYIQPAENQNLFEGDFLYDNKAPHISYESVGDEGQLYIKFSDVKNRKKDEDDYSTNISSLDKLFDNESELRLSPNVPINLNMEIGVVKGELDLGGIQLKNCSLQAGVMKTNIDFAKPNRISMNNMKVEAGVGKLNMYNLGNSNFHHLSFDGGVGSYNLYFEGEFRQKADADIHIGMGTLNLYLPRDIGVRIQVDKSFLTSLVIDDIYKKNDYYYNDQWGKTVASLDISIESGVGKIAIHWLDE